MCVGNSIVCSGAAILARARDAAEATVSCTYSEGKLLRGFSVDNSRSRTKRPILRAGIRCKDVDGVARKADMGKKRDSFRLAS